MITWTPDLDRAIAEMNRSSDRLWVPCRKFFWKCFGIAWACWVGVWAICQEGVGMVALIGALVLLYVALGGGR